MAKIFRSHLIISVAQSNPVLNTQSMFDSNYKESKDSPIDEFLMRLQSINKLAPQPTNFDPYQGQLVMLGTVAAVESFFRTLFRRLIYLDEGCQASVHKRDISYGAAIHLPQELLPEAMLERVSFTSRDNIVDALREFLAVKGALPPELEAAIVDYAQVCQLRHCAVHRFGKLGVNNALSLGIDKHKALLEKPLKFDYAALQNTIAISTGLVKTVNNFLFNEMLSRLPDRSWTNKYATDRMIFLPYYNLFSDKISTNRSVQPKILYSDFIKQLTAHKIPGNGGGNHSAV